MNSVGGKPTTRRRSCSLSDYLRNYDITRPAIAELQYEAIPWKGDQGLVFDVVKYAVDAFQTIRRLLNTNDEFGVANIPLALSVAQFAPASGSFFHRNTSPLLSREQLWRVVRQQMTL